MSGPKTKRIQRRQPPMATGALPSGALLQGAGPCVPGQTAAHPIPDYSLSMQASAGRHRDDEQRLERNAEAPSSRLAERGQQVSQARSAVKRLVHLLARQSALELAQSGALPTAASASAPTLPTPVSPPPRPQRRHSTAEAHFVSQPPEGNTR